MVKKVDTNKARIRRHKRVRGKISGTFRVQLNAPVSMYFAPLLTSMLRSSMIQRA